MSPTVTQPHALEEIRFDRFPFWQGVFDAPGRQKFFPYRLGVHERGFIRQQSGEDVVGHIIDTYADDEYKMPTMPPGFSRWANWLGDLYISYIAGTIPSLAGKTIMEIGAGSFYLANHFLNEKKSAAYVIIDPSLKEAAPDPRISVIREYFDDKLSLDAEPDVIISLNCLEHVDDPFAFLVKANGLLKKKGSTFALIFPDNETQFRMGDFNALCFEHLNYFSEASAGRLLQLAGLRIVSFKKELDTLFYVLERAGEPDVALPAENDHALLATAASRYREGFDAILEKIRAVQAAGKTVALHGACNGMNTLFALGGLPEENILLFDGDETKAGKFIPSSTIPILHASSPRYREADLVVVTAPTFFDQIRSYLVSHHGIPAERIIPVCLSRADASSR